MKKFFYFAAAAVMMLTAACQREMLESPLQGDTKVTFTVSPAEAATKADIADGTNVDILYWEIYDENLTTLLGENSVGKTSDKTFTVDLSLVADQKYKIIFWAEVEGKGHYVTDDLRKVGINYTDENGDPLKANKEERAAFFRVYPFSTENGEPINEDVEIYRPFSQLNLGATTLTTSLNKVNGGQIEVESTSVTVTNIANVFNTDSGKGVGEVPVTFAHAKTPVDDYTQKDLEVGDDTYHWLGMNYLVVNDESDNVTVDIEVKTSVGTVKHSVPNVPIKANYRTNIIGDILTTGATFKVIVDEKFQKPDHITTLDGTYTLTSLADLQWFQQQVNKEGNTFEGKTVKLGADIDLQGAEWEPISGFKGTFDGSSLTKGAADNYTISNFTVNVNENGGFFGSIVGNIKNVNIENATVVSNHFAGALVGYAYGCIENCHASNVRVTSEPELINGKYDNGDKAGAIVGYICGEPMSYLVNCSATNSTITAYRDFGALAGCISGTMTVEGNTANDCVLVLDQIIDGEYVKQDDGTDYPVNKGNVIGRNQTINVSDAEFDAINADAQGVENKKTVALDEGTNDKLAEALNNPDVAAVELPAGEYIMPATAKGKEITFKGTDNPEDVKVGVTKVGTGGENCDYGLDGSTVTFENITITTNSSTYIGYARCNGTYRNCIINGTYTLYGDSVFENCTFNVSGDVYNIWTWGAPTARFVNCTFNSDGKALLLYGTANTKLTVENCTFNDKGGLSDKKAAIEIGNDYNKSYELVVNKTTVNGYEINDNGINTGTTLWANKNSMPQDKLNVVVDGVDVY